MSIGVVTYWYLVAFVFMIVGFFFMTTRMSVAISQYFNIGSEAMRHIYWIYRSPFFVWLTDRRFIVSAVLLFQYDRLADEALRTLSKASFKKGHTLQVGCVSGDITEKFVSKCLGSAHVAIIDMTEAGIVNSRKKLKLADIDKGAVFLKSDAASMPFQSNSFDFVLSFFLFHELPTEKKRQVLQECLRVLRPGGVFTYAEFHRPRFPPLRLLGQIIFGVFEPYAKEMWQWNPQINSKRFEVRRKLILRGYFQIFSITKRLSEFDLE